jgi:hypothetical protein
VVGSTFTLRAMLWEPAFVAHIAAPVLGDSFATMVIQTWSLKSSYCLISCQREAYRRHPSFQFLPREWSPQKLLSSRLRPVATLNKSRLEFPKGNVLSAYRHLSYRPTNDVETVALGIQRICTHTCTVGGCTTVTCNAQQSQPLTTLTCRCRFAQTQGSHYLQRGPTLRNQNVSLRTNEALIDP